MKYGNLMHGAFRKKTTKIVCLFTWRLFENFHLEREVDFTNHKQKIAPIF